MPEQKSAFKIGPARLRAMWDALQQSFWFLPGGMAVGASVLGILLPQIDARADIGARESLQWMATTAGTARVLLTSLASSMITVAGVAFSVTMVTLSLTSSQFGSRLLRTFLKNSVTQFTLGAFLATSLFCMMVLRSVRVTSDAQEVPHLSVALAVSFSVLSFVAFVYFIHHVIASIQAHNVVRSVFNELRDAVDRLFPDDYESNAEEATDERLAEQNQHEATEDVVELTAHDDGYLQAIEVDGIVQTACCDDLTVNLLCRPGHFISCGEPIATITPKDRWTDEAATSICGCFVVGGRRTPRQDIECAVDELVEVAVRALSPGINDPVTAMSCIDYLGAALARLAGRKIPPQCHFDDEKTLRVVTLPVKLTDALDAAFDSIRQHARNSAGVTIRLLEALATIARQVRRDTDRQAVRRQADMIMRGSVQFLPEENDQDDVRTRYLRIQSRLDPESAAT